MFRWLFLILTLFASCQKSAPMTQQTLRINIGADPQTLDPRKARDLTTITLMRMLFEGLTRTSRSGDLELALAQKVDISDDLTQFVFHLRPSFWSNGDPVTSTDFAESWKSILDPAFPTDIASQLYPIKNARKVKLGEMTPDQIGIQTPDSDTLVVDLECPTPYFLELVSMPSFFPVPHQLREANSSRAFDPALHVGNGPFSIEAWVHGDRIHLSKNPHYWDVAQMRIGEIDAFMVEGDTEMRMFEEGELDWAGSPLTSISSDWIVDLKEKQLLSINPLSGTVFLRMNTSDHWRGETNPFSNVHFRKALACALDRQAITDHLLQGGQKPARSLVPPDMGLSSVGYLDGMEPKALLEKALKELHIEKSSLKPFAISYKASNKNSPLVQAIQNQWEDVLGIEVKLEVVEPKTFFQRISQKEFQIILSDWIADFNDPINFLDVFKYKDASTNCTNWESPKYIDLLNRSDLCGDEKKRKMLLSEAEAILMDEMPIIPLFHHALNYMKSEKLENVILSPIGQIDFRNAAFKRDVSSSQEIR